MRAAADFAYDLYVEVGNQKVYAKPPPELMIGLDWLKFHTPPRAGGLRDQPIRLMQRMKIALNTYQCVKTYRSASCLSDKAFGEWASENNQVIEFMQFIWKLQGVFE